MRFNPRKMVAAAALCAFSSAHADTVIGAGEFANGAYFSGGALAWSASAELIDTLNVLQTSVTAIAPASVVEQVTYDPDFEEDVRSSSTAILAIRSITVTDDLKVTGINTAGGVTWTVPRVQGVSKGGTLLIENLSIDIVNRRVYASLTGDFSGEATATDGTGNAVTRLDNVYLWDFSAINGSTQFYPSFAGTLEPVRFSGIHITQQGFAHMFSALRLERFGVTALYDTENYGALTTPVPEPASTTMAAMAVGMLALLCRRQKGRIGS